MTINDIANLAGVSISTVSKIMNGKDEHIHPQTRARVLQIAKEYNYVPYGAVRTDHRTKTFLLGVLVSSFSNVSAFLSHLTVTAQQHGYTLLLLDSQEDPVLEEKHISVLCKNSVDGILWNPVSPESGKLEFELKKYGIPYLHFDGFDTQTSLCINYQAIASALADKLIQLGHQNIACILHRNHRGSDLFKAGFKQSLYQNHINFLENLAILYDDYDYIPDLISRNITAVVVMEQKTAFHIIRTYTDNRNSIPRDLSIATLNYNNSTSDLIPELSSIRLDFTAYADFLISQLISVCEHQNSNGIEHLFTPTDLSVSGSTIAIPFSLHPGKIVVVGSINSDITFHVSSLPQSGKTVRISNSFTTIGGKGANQAIGVARLLHQASLIGELGNDSEASAIFSSLGSENVNTSEVHRDRTSPTGKAYIYLENNGESAITILPGANNNLTPSDIQERKHLFHHANYCLISSEIPLDTVVEAAKVAYEMQTKTIMKPASIREMPTELYQYIDIFIPNKKEAALLCPLQQASIEEQAGYFRNQGIPIVIITLGRQGFYLATETISRYYPVSDIKPLDTTGGADAFISALASYLSDGYSIETAAQIANYAAGFCISRQGVFSALVDRFTLETHIMKVQPDLLVH